MKLLFLEAFVHEAFVHEASFLEAFVHEPYFLDNSFLGLALNVVVVYILITVAVAGDVYIIALDIDYN